MHSSLSFSQPSIFDTAMVPGFTTSALTEALKDSWAVCNSCVFYSWKARNADF